MRDLGAVGVAGAAALAIAEDEEEDSALPVAEVEEEALPDDEIPDWLLDLDAADVEEFAEPRLPRSRRKRSPRCRLPR